MPSKKTIYVSAAVVAVLVLAVVVLRKGSVTSPGAPDFSKFENHPLPPPAALSGRQVYQVLENPNFTPSIAGVIIDPVDVAGGDTQNIYVLMVSDVLPTSTPTLPPGTAGKIDVSSQATIRGYVSVADGKSAEIRTDFTSSTLPIGTFGQPYSVNASGTVLLSPSQGPSGKVISVFKADVTLPKAFGSANRFFISVSDATGRMRGVAINRQTSCEYPNGGDWSPAAECNLSYVGGVDNGSLNLSAETDITLDAPFAINQGKTVSISSLGSLAVNLTSGGLKNGFVWRAFDDKDGSAQKIGDGAPSGYYRRYLFPNPPEFQPKGKFGLSESKETFSVTENASVWPKIYQAVIDPPDVHVGDTQNLGIVVQAEAGQKIASVVAEIETDKDTVKLPLALQGETAEADIRPNPYYVDMQSQLAIRTAAEMQNIASLGANVAKAASSPKYTYSDSWVVRDTHDTKYHTTFIVTDSSGRINKLTLAWSDACGIPTGGNWTISAACALAFNDGVDNGSVTISGGWTLTINSNVSFNFNPGQTITVAAGSSIVLGSGTSQIAKKYILYTDGDGDRYAPSGSTQTFSDSASISGYTRRYNLLGGYFAPVDCYDSNAAAKPGQILWYTTSRGDASYDYNCDSVQTKGYTASAGTGNGAGRCYDYSAACYQQSGTAGWIAYPGSAPDGGAGAVPACGSTGHYIIAGGTYGGTGVFGCASPLPGSGQCYNSLTIGLTAQPCH